MSPVSTSALEAIIGRFSAMPGGLLPALHAIQHELGYVHRDCIPLLAQAFNQTVSEIHGVITYYKDFRTEAPAGPVVHVCRAEACQARGGRAVWDRAQRSAPGAAVQVEEVFCLGHCALGPAVAVGGNLYGGVTPDGFESIIAEATNHRVPTPKIDSCSDGVTVFVPRDAASRAAGADDVAAALASKPGVRVVRNGSWGMLWLEPMIEVQTGTGRIAYGPVQASDIPGLLSAGLLRGGEHPLRLGPTHTLPWMKRQQRFTFARVGLVDPRSSADYEANGGMTGLRRALGMGPAEIVKEVTDSGLRGRGGAAFPTGIKWRTVLEAGGRKKYIVCNADEGDSGTFADRMLMEGDPFTLLEGMTIAARAVGADEGYIYVRSEYPDAIEALQAAIDEAHRRGWLGENILGSGLNFRIHVRVGAGSYVCGEETALLESLEGKRGVVRAKPPLPAHVGLFGQPTVINNVLSLATVPAILAKGASAYAALGFGRSRGTQVLQLAGNIARGGILEVAFGATLGEVVNEFGGGTANDRPVRAVQVGGPLGAYLPPEQFHLPFDYESFAAVNAIVGHGGIVVFDDTVNMAEQARFAMEFCALESCGKCTPCRIGSTRGVELMDKIIGNVNRDANIELLEDLCEVMADGSLCAMGGLTPLPVRSALHHFTEDFQITKGTAP
ncbi:MAG: formate dehydrogenase iron-sulfur subunit [Verrucomicrobia bacterium]|nr:MAG: formate dehydrogenase iron-sulfur subunit [Verrucomicrobiota bacterium]